MAEFGASSFCSDCSAAVDSTGGSEGAVVEESGFRGAGDLSAPWLRPFGRDDGWVLATSVVITGLDRVQFGLKRRILGFLCFAVTQLGGHL